MIKFALIFMLSTFACAQFKLTNIGIVGNHSFDSSIQEENLKPIILQNLEEIIKHKDKLSGTHVEFYAEIARIYTSQTTGKSWVHLIDKSSSKAPYRIVVNTDNGAKLKTGMPVKVMGILQTDYDYGQGYFFPVFITDAQINRVDFY